MDTVPSEVKSFVFGFAYGKIRQPLNDMMRQVLGNTPLGNMGDEILVTVGLVAAKRLIKNSLVSQIARTGLAIEGNNMAQGTSFGLGQKTSTVQGMTLV